MRRSILIPVALAVLAGCAAKGKEAQTAASSPEITPAAVQPGAARMTGTPAQTVPPPAVDEGWPRTHESGGTTTKIFQPQLESWDGVALKANAAVEVDPTGGEPVFGVAQMTARTTAAGRPLGRRRFGRVGDWRADRRLRWVPHGFRRGPQSGCHRHVSSPRHIERSVRFSSHYAHLFASCHGL